MVQVHYPIISGIHGRGDHGSDEPELTAEGF